MSMFLVIHLVVSFLFACVRSQGCELPMTIDNEEHMPVIIDNSTSKAVLSVPENGKIELHKNDKIILSCPNIRNFLNYTRTNATLASCVSGDTVQLIKKQYHFDSIVCAKGVRGSALSTDKACGGNLGNIIQLGFRYDGKLLPLIDVCYDPKNGNALYAIHTIKGREIKYSSKSSFRPGFSTEGLGPDIAASVAYTKKFQKAAFSNLLKSATLAEKYIDDKSFLARGHLAADADFLFLSWQMATFFYVNTVPQWQAINNGNWKKLEKLSRNTAQYYREDLQVYTGQFGVLELPDVNNNPTEIYLLAKEKLAVPKFVWKIFYSTKTSKSIAFVSLNNPFARNLFRDDQICQNICKKYGWDDQTWTNGTKGFIYCCDTNDLLNVVKVGLKLKIAGILDAPKSSNRRKYYSYRV